MRARHAASGAIVVGCAVAVWAGTSATGDDLVVTPSIGVHVQANGAAGSTSFMVATTGSASVVVDKVVQDPTCEDPALVLASGAGFTVTSASPHVVAVTCPATAAYDIRRCLFDALDSSGDTLASFMAVCIADNATSLAASPESLAFASQPVGTLSTPQTVMIHNTNATTAVSGKLQLQIDQDLANDYLVGAPCVQNDNGCDGGMLTIPAGGTFAVTVYCLPSATTPPPANFYVSVGGATLAQPVTLTCSANAASGAAIDVTTTPSPLDVGSVEVTGTHTGSGTVHVKNVGTQTLTLTGITIAGAGSDWTYAVAPPCGGLPCAIAPSATNDVAVTFDPSKVSTRNATMQLMSNASNGQLSVILYGTGTGATLELDPADPTAIDFGLVPKNGMATLPIHLINRGNRDLTDATLTLAPTTGFSVMPVNPVTVSAQTGQTVMLTCSPNGATSQLQTTFTASAPDTVNDMPVTITATCTGTDAQLVANPSALELGQIRTGESSVSKIVDLDNTGTMPLTLAGDPTMDPDIPAISLVPPSTQTIAAHSMQPLGVSVATSAVGDLTTTISATDDVDSGYTLQVPVTGSVVSPAVTVPASVTLGTFCVNQPTSPATITLVATGTCGPMPCSVKLVMPTAPAMMMGSASPFTATERAPLSYPAILDLDDTAQVDVQPARASTAGMVSDTLDWSTDIPSDLAPTTAVTATFLDDGAAIAPASLDFGAVAVHLPPNDTMPVTIQNCSDGPISLTATIDQPFAFDGSEFPSSLMPAQTATFGVSFEPTKIQHYSGYLNIVTHAASQAMLTVKLDGDGVAGDMGGDGSGGSAGGNGTTSFYACSCTSSRPGGGLPIVAALLAITLRRRRGSSSAR
ncbi:MAG TPA: choice-of-anchor D domain-containing protein [Kofleriaceae bacterium]|nr:choice-of-anchor D domain-containing protein [Kofleriaceae bacterium]